MHLPQLEARVGRRSSARLEVLDATDSTNARLLAHATGADAVSWGHGSVVVTDAQTAGRGRLGRVWAAPPGGSLAISLLLRPAAPTSSFGWLPILAGAAAVRTVRAAGAPAVLKWPNDVLLAGAPVAEGGVGGKLAGILSELLPDARGVVVGMGLNHRLRPEDLPVATATSLAIAGAATDADALLDGWLAAVDDLLTAFDAAGGDAVASGLHAEAEAVSATVGREVRVVLPGGVEQTGRAVGIDRAGRLRFRTADGEEQPVSAGDVLLVRPATGP